MSFWSFWSRRPVSLDLFPVEPERRPSFGDEDREYVRRALDQFEAAGLQIWSELNRDLVVVRALIDINRWKSEGGPRSEDLRSLFVALADGTDSLTWYSDAVEGQFPLLASMDDEGAEAMLEAHSGSIFVNARSVTTVNEDNSLENMVYQFAALGDLDVTQVTKRVTNNGLARLSFQVEGLGACQFEIQDTKYPDISPVLAEMNRIAKNGDLGHYVLVPGAEGIFIFTDDAKLKTIAGLLDLPEAFRP